MSQQYASNTRGSTVAEEILRYPVASDEHHCASLDNDSEEEEDDDGDGDLGSWSH
jgi:hypothetical protein